tara:strand:+ start:42 stop:269 length:228 start_codon:yes stop_codon:yes gene_type:complete
MNKKERKKTMIGRKVTIKEITGFDSEEEFNKAMSDHAKIMEDVHVKFKDSPKDKFGYLIISEEIENYILKRKGLK